MTAVYRTSLRKRSKKSRKPPTTSGKILPQNSAPPHGRGKPRVPFEKIGKKRGKTHFLFASPLARSKGRIIITPRDGWGFRRRLFTSCPPPSIVCSAGVAQLAEHNVANVVVEGSSPFARSMFNLVSDRRRFRRSRSGVGSRGWLLLSRRVWVCQVFRLRWEVRSTASGVFFSPIDIAEKKNYG